MLEAFCVAPVVVLFVVFWTFAFVLHLESLC
jgi:hypothetical protein